MISKRLGSLDVAGVAAAVQLGQELRGTDDRPSDQLGEERQVDREVEQFRRLFLAAVDVDDI
jgi:hypothetical protein